MTRKRKHNPATEPQAYVLAKLLELGATSSLNAVTMAHLGPGLVDPTNALNRCYSRGWVGRAGDPRNWWLTEAGALHLSALEGTGRQLEAAE